MKVTAQQRSMIASAFVGALSCRLVASPTNPDHVCLCCAADAEAACAAVVGKRAAERLRSYAYDALACGVMSEEKEQYFLDKVSELETL